MCGGGGVWIDVSALGTRRNVLTRNIHKHTIFDVFAASLYIGGGGWRRRRGDDGNAADVHTHKVGG